MADSLQTFELKTVNDFKFLSCVIGDKLRNPQFQPVKRQVFLKTLLQQIKQSCSLKTYERIQKSLNQIAQQKDNDQKQLKAKLKQQSNRKQKKLVSAKQKGYTDKYGQQIQDYASQQQQEQQYEEDQYAKYQK